MKKILAFTLIFFCTISSINAEEIKRIFVGNKNAKITIIAFESLTCSHCANFHEDVYPQLKKEYLDTGLAKIEFRHFPLDIAALNASKVSQCKNDGDSSMLNSLFANQQKWVKGSSVEEANENLQKFLESEGFNVDFKKCIEKADFAHFKLEIPEFEYGFKSLLSPLLMSIPAQLLAYHVAKERGTDVDQPRNLAKSVTVE